MTEADRLQNVQKLDLAPCICGAPMEARRLIELLLLNCSERCGVEFRPSKRGVIGAAKKWNKLRGYKPAQDDGLTDVQRKNAEIFAGINR